MTKLSNQLIGIELDRSSQAGEKTVLDVAIIKPSKTVDSTMFMPQVHKKLLPALSLTVLNGSERGRIIELDVGKNTFGRKPTNQIHFPDASISSTHGVIEYTKEAMITVYDTASRNGISLNGKVAPVLTVKTGQVVQIGSIYLCVGKTELSKNPFTLFKMLTPKTKNTLLVVGVVTLSLVSAMITYRMARTPKAEMTKPSTMTAAVPKAQSRVATRSFRTLMAPVKQPRENNRAMIMTAKVNEADEFLQHGDYQRAFLGFQEVLQIDKQNTVAKEGVQQLEAIATKMIEEAMMVSAIDLASATARINTVMKITEVQSELYERAKGLLAKWRKA